MARCHWSGNKVARRNGFETPPARNSYPSIPFLYDPAFGPVVLRRAMETLDGHHIPSCPNQAPMQGETLGPDLMTNTASRWVFFLQHRLPWDGRPRWAPMTTLNKEEWGYVIRRVLVLRPLSPSEKSWGATLWFHSKVSKIDHKLTQKVYMLH